MGVKSRRKKEERRSGRRTLRELANGAKIRIGGNANTGDVELLGTSGDTFRDAFVFGANPASGENDVVCYVRLPNGRWTDDPAEVDAEIERRAKADPVVYGELENIVVPGEEHDS